MVRKRKERKKEEREKREGGWRWKWEGRERRKVKGRVRGCGRNIGYEYICGEGKREEGRRGKGIGMEIAESNIVLM